MWLLANKLQWTITSAIFQLYWCSKMVKWLHSKLVQRLNLNWLRLLTKISKSMDTSSIYRDDEKKYATHWRIFFAYKLTSRHFSLILLAQETQDLSSSFWKDTTQKCRSATEIVFHIFQSNNESVLWIVIVQIQLLSFYCMNAAKCCSFSNQYPRILILSEPLWI